jgi:uncharacterized protein
MGFLPWWLGAPALALVTIGFFLLTKRTMGVSGSFGRVLDAKAAREQDRIRAQLDEDPEATREALRLATMEEFGTAMPPSDGGQAATATAAVLPTLPWGVHVTFVAFIFVGGLIMALAMGRFSARMELCEEFGHVVASGWHVWPALAIGGVLVGFGTRMAGGCTTGHGLTGCARMQIGSLLATGIFVGCAVAVSIVLGVLAS